MKKIIGLIIGVLIIAYSAFWYYGAKKAKELVVTKINEWQKNERNFAGLKYDDIEMGGYPFSYEMTFKNLKANLLDKNGNTTYEVKFDEPYVVGTNVLGTKFWKTAKGNIHFFTPENGVQGGKEDWVISGINTVQANVDRPLNMDTFVHPFSHLPRNQTELERFYENVDFLSWTGKDIKVFNAQYDSIPVYEMRDGTLAIGKKHQGDKAEALDWNVNLKQFSFLWNFRDYFPTADNSLDEIALMLALPNPGKMNLDIAGNAIIPNEKAFEGLNNVTLENVPTFEINGTKWNYFDDFRSFSSNGFMRLTPVVDGKRNLNINLDAYSLTTPAQFEQLQKQWEHFLDQTALCKSDIPTTQAEGNPKVCHSLKGILPKLGELGKIKTNWVIDVALHDLVNPEKGTELSVKHFDHTTDLYGVKSNGEISLKFPEIQGQYTLDLLNYLPLIEDTIAYLNRIFVVLPEVNPEAFRFVPKSLNPQFTKGLVQYLESISDEPTQKAKDLKITIQWTDPLNIKIGTLNLSKFIEATEKFEKSLKEESLKGDSVSPTAPQLPVPAFQDQTQGVPSNADQSLKPASLTSEQKRLRDQNEDDLNRDVEGDDPDDLVDDDTDDLETDAPKKQIQKGLPAADQSLKPASLTPEQKRLRDQNEDDLNRDVEGDDPDDLVDDDTDDLEEDDTGDLKTPKK